MGQQIYNSEVLQEVIKRGKLLSASGVPNQLNDKIQASMEINPQIIKNADSSFADVTNSTSGNIAIPTDRDVYIIGATLSVIKDVTATSTKSEITYKSENGQTKSILGISGITLTPQSNSISISLSHPIKIQFGTTPTIANSSATGNIKTCGSLFFFTDDSTKS